jgi:hypothetical protein
MAMIPSMTQGSKKFNMPILLNSDQKLGHGNGRAGSTRPTDQSDKIYQVGFCKDRAPKNCDHNIPLIISA